MGAPIVGRTDCPECGFGAAHVKKSEKCLYRYCPSCGAMYHATGAEREKRLRERMRPTEGAPAPAPAPVPTPTPTPTPAAPAPAPDVPPTPTPTPPKPAKRRGLFA